MFDKEILKIQVCNAYSYYSNKIVESEKKGINKKTTNILSALFHLSHYDLDNDTFYNVDNGVAYVNVVFSTPILDKKLIINPIVDNLKDELSTAVKFTFAYIMGEEPENITVDVVYADDDCTSDIDVYSSTLYKESGKEDTLKTNPSAPLEVKDLGYECKLTFSFDVFTRKAKNTRKKVLAYLLNVVARVYEREGKKLNWEEFYFKKGNSKFIKASRLEQETVIKFIKRELMRGKNPLINDKYVLINRSMKELKEKVELLLSHYLKENTEKVDKCVICGKEFYKTKEKHITCGNRNCTMKRMRTKNYLMEAYYFYDDWKINGKKVEKDEIICELLKRKSYKKLYNPEKLIRTVMDEIERESKKQK